MMSSPKPAALAAQPTIRTQRERGATAPPRALLREMARRRQAYFLLAPILLIIIVFDYYPPISGLYHAFFNWTPGNPSTFVGLDNFKAVVSANDFGLQCWNMVKLVGFGAVIAIVAPLAVALLLFHLRNAVAKEIYRLLIIVPTVVPGIVGLLVWKYLYDPNLGLINALLSGLGLGGLAHDWLADPNVALYSVLFVGFPWLNGTSVLIFLAGLSTIPAEILEASELDGCAGWRRIWAIELPLIGGQVRLLTTLSVIAGLQAYENLLVLTNGNAETNTPALNMYKTAFSDGYFGQAAAIGCMLFAVCFALTLLINRGLARQAARVGS